MIVKRAKALAASLREIPGTNSIRMSLIVGNRTPGIRAGVVFPEAGVSWLAREIETIDSRPQDPFFVRDNDIDHFIDFIEPFWRGKTLEDDIYSTAGAEIRSIEKVIKINQKDHARDIYVPMLLNGWNQVLQD